jgi:hypothetical protein
MMKIARLALALGLLTSVSAQVYASGLVLNDNELRNDLSWLSDRGVIQLSLSTWPLSQEEITRALKKPNLPILLNRWCWRVLTSGFPH